MLTRILTGFTDCDLIVGPGSDEKFFQTSFVNFRVRIQDENEFRPTNARKTIHASRKTVIPPGPQEVCLIWQCGQQFGKKFRGSVFGIVVEEEHRHRYGYAPKTLQKTGNQRLTVVQQYQHVYLRCHEFLPDSPPTSAGGENETRA